MFRSFFRTNLSLILIASFTLSLLTIGNTNHYVVNGQDQSGSTLIIPRGLPVITTENAHLLEPVAKLGRGTPENVRWTSDGSRLVVASFSSVWVYDANDFSEPIRHLEQSADSHRIVDAALSPDGNSAIVAELFSVRLWDLTSENDPIVLTEFTDPLRETAIGFSPDGRVAYATPENSVQMRQIETGETLIFEGHTGIIRALDFSPDGLLMVTASEDGTARIWNTQNGEELQQFSIVDLALVAAAFSPDGNSVAIAAGRAFQASYNPNEPPSTYPIVIFDLVSNEQGAVFSTTNTPTSLSFSADGRFLVEYGHVFDIEQGSQVNVPAIAEGRKSRFSPSGEFVATILSEGPQILNASDYSVHTTLPFYGYIQFVDFDRDANLMMWQTGFNTQVIDLSTGLVHADLLGLMGRQFTDNGELITVNPEGTIQWWNVQTQEIVDELQVNELMGALVLSDDGGRLLYLSQDGALRLWDVGTETLLLEDVPGPPYFGPLLFSEDETLILQEVWGRISVWDIATGEKIINVDNLLAGAISPDGNLIVYQQSDEDVVNVADSHTGEILARFPIITGAGIGIDFNHSGTILMIGSSNYLGGDGAVHVIDVERLEEIDTYEFRGMPWGARFSPDDTYMTLYGESETLTVPIVELWNLETGEQIGTIENIAGASVARFNADQSLLITGAGTFAAHIIDTATGEVLALMDLQGSGAINYWFGPDDTFIANAAADGTVWLWGIAE